MSFSASFGAFVSQFFEFRIRECFTVCDRAKTLADGEVK
ncbi:hypothetical protein COO91_02069 [Nostoc flagelliforme CCNUN1]|uniref:Uncharacterized protein n=1 Tax=Nostoc flagelliforme CCNUN1 TaxID=2038116 RepID=A0A2K8SL85_9NOSO|nr:hypothetical protein COO91_02069 [Nostoc flagelliforme CCNUN1]